MLVEKSREEALKDFLRGKKVIVLVDYDDASLDADLLENMLPEEFHYLVNVPEVSTPEEIIGAVHETQGESVDTPPKTIRRIESCLIQEN